MLYLFYREDRDAGFSFTREGEARALARAVDYDVRALARAVEERYADPAGAFNVQHLDGAEAQWNDVVSACSVLPFLSTHQVVRLSGLIGASAQRRARSGDDPTRPGVSPEGLASLAGDLPDTTILIMQEGALRATNAHLKALEKLDVHKEIHACTMPQGEQRVAWVRDEAGRRGGAVEPQAARLLAELPLSSMWSLSSAVDTLIAYAGPSGRVTAPMVREMVIADEDVSGFALSDAIAARDAGRALKLLHDLLARGMAEEQVMAMLVGRVRDWTLAAAFKADRVAEGETIKRLGWSPGKHRAAARGAASFARGELPRAYQALVIADEALKSRPGDERSLILDTLVLTLASRGDPELLRQIFPVPLAT